MLSARSRALAARQLRRTTRPPRPVGSAGRTTTTATPSGRRARAARKVRSAPAMRRATRPEVFPAVCVPTSRRARDEQTPQPAARREGHRSGHECVVEEPEEPHPRHRAEQVAAGVDGQRRRSHPSRPRTAPRWEPDLGPRVDAGSAAPGTPATTASVVHPPVAHTSAAPIAPSAHESDQRCRPNARCYDRQLARTPTPGRQRDRRPGRRPAPTRIGRRGRREHEAHRRPAARPGGLASSVFVRP